MNHGPTPRHRRSIRLPAYDYASPGAYFVTLVCHGREPILDNALYRDIVEEAWLWLAERYEHVALDEYAIMPNHLHGVITLTDGRRGGSRTAPTPTAASEANRKPLGRLVGAFKTVSTKRINRLRATPGTPVWQRNYYERIVRDERELDAVRRYVTENPLRWAEDPDNPRFVALEKHR